MLSWVRQHRRWLRRSVCALTVLVLVGFVVRAPVKDWWLAREACGGKLSAGDLETVRTEARLGAERESFNKHQGQYRCVLENDEGKAVVAVDVFLGRNDRETELSRVGSEYQPHATLPGGLPGFESGNSRVYLMPECPGGGKNASRDHRRLLVGTWTFFAESREEKAAMLRLSVRMTNEAREKLGCGGKPLSVPEGGAVPDEGEYVSRAEAKGTPCEALASAGAPTKGRDGKISIRVAEGGVVGRCTLHAPRTPTEQRAGRPGRPLVELTSWRGNWGGELREMGSGPDPLPMPRGGPWMPTLTADRAWAVARCDGENAGFAAHWGNDFGHEEEGDAPESPKTEPEQREDQVRLREYVAAFARDQVRREECTGLRLPERL